MLKKLRRRLAVIFTSLTGAILGVALVLSLLYSITQLKSDNDKWMASLAGSVTDALYSSTTLENSSFFVQEEEPYIITVHKNGKPFIIGDGWAPQADREMLFETAANTSYNLGYASQTTAAYTSRYAQTMPDAMIVAGNEAHSPQQDYGVSAPDTSSPAPRDGVLNSLRGNEAPHAPQDVSGSVVASAPTQTEEMITTEPNFPQDFPLENEDRVEMSITLSDNVIGDNELFTLTDANGGQYRALFIPVTFPSYESYLIDLYEIAIFQDLRVQEKDVRMLYLGYGGLFLLGLCMLAIVNWILAKQVIKPTADGIQRQSDFVAAASHELRSPLAVVRSSLSAANAAKNTEEAKKYRKAAENEAERMSKLIEDLLLLAGGDTGSWKVQNTVVDMDTLLIETSEQFRPLAKSKSISLSLQLPDKTLPPVQGDMYRLRQILAVLLDNALQYAPKDSEITLSACHKKTQIEISVADKGKGIEQDTREKVFDRFFRADASRTDKSHFGLGLSVARELAQLHSGTLTAHETSGGGATFKLTLPIKTGTAKPKN